MSRKGKPYNRGYSGRSHYEKAASALYARYQTRRNEKKTGRKFTAISKVTGDRCSAIELLSSVTPKVAVGMDVWRLSDKMDTCSYYFEVMTADEFNENYSIEEKEVVL